jgi:hypothetical protein
MTENAIPDALRATSVADYIVQRLAAEGIAHCFGVAGDYAFPLCDAVDRSPDVGTVSVDRATFNQLGVKILRNAIE